MQAHYGFKDGSGEWFIILDTEKCDGCGDCVPACPADVLELGDDEYDPFSEKTVARVKDQERKKIRYSCAPCQPGYGQTPAPCVAACRPAAIEHSEGWKLLYGRS